jgi:hypothetical protein
MLVASSPELIAKDQGDLWDSGKVSSDEMYQVAYAGSPLKSDQAVWWKVSVWDGADQVSAWSSPAQWTMGARAPSDWQAQWVIEWLYHDLAGIQLDQQAPGFKHFIIHPNVVGDLTEVKANYDSVRGHIVREWKIEKNILTLHVVVPPNTTATIDLPTGSQQSVTESGKPIAQSNGIEFWKFANSCASYHIGSGDYTFESELPSK